MPGHTTFALLLWNPVSPPRCYIFAFSVSSYWFSIFISWSTQKKQTLHDSYICFFRLSSSSSLLMTSGTAMITRRTSAGWGTFKWSSSPIYVVVSNYIWTNFTQFEACHDNVPQPPLFLSGHNLYEDCHSRMKNSTCPWDKTMLRWTLTQYLLTTAENFWLLLLTLLQ